MTVTDYHIQFERLSQYASHFVATEELRVQRFVEGLRPYIFRVLAGIEMTYEEALNRALAIERGGRDRGGSSRDSRKRSRPDVAHGGHQGRSRGGSRGDDGQGRQDQQGPLQSQTIQGSQTASTAHSRGPSQHPRSSDRAPDTCITCGKRHFGPCRQGFPGCYQCGQMGHFARNCPMSHSQPSTSGASAPAVPGGHVGGSWGRGSSNT